MKVRCGIAASGLSESWMTRLDDRQRKEVELARLYARDFAHGTAGHHRLMLIAKLAELLDGYERGQ